jgi:N-acetylneuraminic acid mutarotase
MLLNDLWSFDVVEQTWQRLGGSSSGNAWSTSSWPGARRSSAVWTLADGSVCLFGGHGLSAQGLRGELSDLWKFDGRTWRLLGSSEGVVLVPVNEVATASWPGARRAAQAFVDGSTNDMYLFGGFGFGANVQTSGSLSDVWRYQASSNRWELVAGRTTTLNDQGNYGIKGVSAASNYPPARSDMAGWSVGSKLYMFGGFGPQGFYNDVWVLDQGIWTWIAGESGPNQPGSAFVPGNRFGATAHVRSRDPTKILLFGGYSNLGPLNELWELDLSSKSFSRVGGRPGPYWTSNPCSRGFASAEVVPGSRTRHGSWMMDDGSLYVFGGVGLAKTSTAGYLNDLYVLKVFQEPPTDLCRGEVAVQYLNGQIVATSSTASATSQPGSSDSTTIAVAVSVSVGVLVLLGVAAMLVYKFVIKNTVSSKMIQFGSPMSPRSPVSPQQLILELKDLRTSGTDHKILPNQSLSPRRALDFDASE